MIAIPPLPPELPREYFSSTEEYLRYRNAYRERKARHDSELNWSCAAMLFVVGLVLVFVVGVFGFAIYYEFGIKGLFTAGVLVAGAFLCIAEIKRFLDKGWI